MVMGRTKKKAGAPKKTGQRVQVLRLLSRGRKTKKMLVELTGIDKTQLLRVLNELKKKELIKITKKKKRLKVDGRASIYKLRLRDSNAVKEINEITGLHLGVMDKSIKYNYKVKMLNLLLEGPKTKKELMRASGASEAVFYKILKKFKNEGFIIESGKRKPRGGELVHIFELRRNAITEKYPELAIQTKKEPKAREKRIPERKAIVKEPKKVSPQMQTFLDRMKKLKKKK